MMSVVLVLLVFLLITFIAVVLLLLLPGCFQQHAIIQRLHELYKRCSCPAGKGSESESESDWCAVCLCQAAKGEPVRSLPGCKHRFHGDCIGAWLKDHDTCPLCRNQVTDHLCSRSQKQGKMLRQYSLIHMFQSFSDVFIALLYMTLPASIRDSFPLVH